LFSSEDIEKAKKIIAELSQLNLGQGGSSGKKSHSGDGRKAHPKMNNKGSTDNSYTPEGISILPSELLVIAGLICDVLQVNSVLVNRNQEVQIILTGTLKTSTQLDKVMKQLGHMPFEQVMRCIMDNCNR
jgi:hypothetical protein